MTDTTGFEMTCDAFADRLADYLEGDAPEAARLRMDAHAASCESCGALLADLLRIPEAAAALPPLTPSRDLWAGIAERIDARVLPLEAPRATRTAPALLRGWRRQAIAAAALVLFTASATYVVTRATLAPATTTAALPAAAQPTAAPVAEPTARFSSTDVERGGEALTGAARTETADADARRTAAPRAARGEARPAAAAPAAGLRLVSGTAPLPAADPVYDREIAKLRTIVRQRHSQLDPATIAVLEQSMAVIDSAIAQSRAALAKDPASGFLATQLNHSLETKVELLRTAASLPART